MVIIDINGHIVQPAQQGNRGRACQNPREDFQRNIVKHYSSLPIFAPQLGQ